MERERFKELMEGKSNFDKYDDDNTVLGLLIIRKYLPRKGIEGAEHDVIYSVSIDELIEAGITEEDVIELRNLNWMIDDAWGMACFV